MNEFSQSNYRKVLTRRQRRMKRQRRIGRRAKRSRKRYSQWIISVRSYLPLYDTLGSLGSQPLNSALDTGSSSSCTFWCEHSSYHLENHRSPRLNKHKVKEPVAEITITVHFPCFRPPVTMRTGQSPWKAGEAWLSPLWPATTFR